MGALAMPFETLPLGFRFKPTDVELIDHYLRLKINGKDDDVACIKEVDICRVEPWDLPDLSAIKTNDHEWFFFCPRDRKYPNGHRSNRATEAGYWKATGKDRTIKSRKLGIIGMKKTLVFYTGRAPKGQRTSWVIHEYRATLDELDGSHPGQGAFVLCRLFKKADDIKQDDNDEISHSDELEANVLSPNPTNISQEDIRSEPAVVQDSPVSVEQSVEQQVGSEHRVVKTSDSITSETIYSDRPQVNEEMTHEVDSHFNEYFYDPPEQYFKWQSMANPEPVGMQDIFPTDIGDGHNGFHLQDINGNRDPISDFLDSVINPDVSLRKEAGHQGVRLVDSDMWKNSSIKETGSCSGSDVEVVQQQHDHKDLIHNHSLADDADIFCDDYLMRFVDLPNAVDTTFYNPPNPDNFVMTEDGQLVGHHGIKIRSQDRGRQLPSYASNQGDAPRRIRLQTFEDEGKDSYSVVTDRSCSTTAVNESDSPGLDSSSVITPAEDFFCLEDLDNLIAPTEEGKNLNTNEVVETGIKIRTHHQRSHPTLANSVQQGTARRRIRLLKRQSFNTEDVDEKQCADNPDDFKNSSSFKSSVSVHIIKVVTVVFLFVASIGLLIARGDFLLSS